MRFSDITNEANRIISPNELGLPSVEDDRNDSPGMLDQPDTQEIEMEMQELEDAMYTVIEIAQSLRRSGRTVSGPFSGQLDSYFIPWMKSFIEDSSQPGSIASLRRMLERD